MLRQLDLTVDLLRHEGNDYDVFIVDQLSACIPTIRRMLRGRVLFYCHFPDQLLADHKSLVKQIYRAPFDWFEQWSTGLSDVIVVNSKFTQSVFKQTFPRISTIPNVVYPCVDVEKPALRDPELEHAIKNRRVLVSINRFEDKKNVALAIESFAAVDEVKATSVLIIAGGYDTRVAENVENLKKLELLCRDLKLSFATSSADNKTTIASALVSGVNVIFAPSISTATKDVLLSNAHVLLYTPTNEHFGIVPLEAMLVGTPVLATNTGGPLETIVDGVTGWTRANEDWPAALEIISRQTHEAREKMSLACTERVKAEFSQRKMTDEFDSNVELALSVKRQPLGVLTYGFEIAAIIMIMALALAMWR